MKIRAESFWFIWCCIALSFLSGAYAEFFTSGSDSREAGSGIFQFSLLVSFGAFICVVFSFKLSGLVASLNSIFPLVLLITFASLSIIWAAEPIIALKRIVSLLLTLLFLFAVTLAFSKEQITKLLLFLVCSTLFSIAISLLFNAGFQTGDHDGLLKGFSGHKNTLGKYLSFCVLFLTCSYLAKKSTITLILLLISFSFLLLTGSKTSLAGVLVSILLIPFLQFLVSGWSIFPSTISRKAKTNRRVIFLIVGLVIFTTLYTSFTLILDLLGRDLTFTGRNKIWEFGFFISQETMWLGNGYRSFWVDSVTSDFFLFNPYWEGGKITANGHNGYFDLYFELGLIGVLLFFYWSLDLFKKVFIQHRDHKNLDVFTMFAPPFVLFVYVYNIFETSFLDNRPDQLWVILIIIYLQFSSLKVKRGG